VILYTRNISTPRRVSGRVLLVCHGNNVLSNTAVDVWVFEKAALI